MADNNGLALMIRTDNKSSVKIYEIHPNKSNQYCIKGQFPFDRLIDLLEYCSGMFKFSQKSWFDFS